MSETIETMTGYKATSENMTCRGFQFEFDKWHEVEGELEMCKNGFHFCEQPSGVWNYYSDAGTRVFKVEAREVLAEREHAGTATKRVARFIRFVPNGEIKPDGNSNTGDSNTGDSNTGHCNTGHFNTGHCNTGNSNTGHCNTGNSNTGHSNTGDFNTGNFNTGYCNTGYCNTGHRNTGNFNTGHCNTGDSNTGHCNTGHFNTGDSNTGNRNTGNFNTGDYNATNYSTGYFCVVEPMAVSFDEPTEFTHAQFRKTFADEIYALDVALRKDEPIDFEKFKDLPNITPEKLLALHEAHKAGREAAKAE